MRQEKRRSEIRITIMNTFLRLSCKVIRNEFRKKKVSMCTKQEVHALSLSEATVACLNANNSPIIDLSMAYKLDLHNVWYL